MNMNFNLAEKFCDSEELENSWHNTNIPGTIVSFFAELFNISKPHLLKDIHFDEIGKSDETIDEYEFHQSSSSDMQRKNRLLKSIKIKSIVQILYTVAENVHLFML